MSFEVLLVSAFLAGFFGGTHCIGMCGAIVVLFEGQQGPAGAGARWLYRLLYNSGRLGFYALLGTIAGAGGAVLSSAMGLSAGLMILRVLAGLLVIAIGLNLLTDWRLTAPLERAGARLWQNLSPLARHVLPATTPLRALATGLIWGALPCGLVYSAVALAATSGSAAGGGLVMLAFWAGTLPALLLAGAFSGRLMAWRSRLAVRRVAGIIVIALGLLALAPIAKKVVSPDGGHHHGAVIGRHRPASAALAPSPPIAGLPGTKKGAGITGAPRAACSSTACA